MSQAGKSDTLNTVAAEAFDALTKVRQISPFSSRPEGLSIDDSYRVMSLVKKMYEARGSKVIGRKIGFTNRNIWAQYNVYAPVWGYVFDSTLFDRAQIDALSVASLSEPRIEPEIVFGLSRAPSADMDETALSSCIEWIALGFEIVQSVFPEWKFSAADTVAANGLHGILVTGPRQPFAPRSAEWRQTLSTFRVDLTCNGQLVDQGEGANVLDGPVSALRHLVGLLARDPVNPPLAAGEIITTGTLTKAMPIGPGEVWAVKPSGIALDEISLRIA